MYVIVVNPISSCNGIIHYLYNNGIIKFYGPLKKKEDFKYDGWAASSLPPTRCTHYHNAPLLPFDYCTTEEQTYHFYTTWGQVIRILVITHDTSHIMADNTYKKVAHRTFGSKELAAKRIPRRCLSVASQVPPRISRSSPPGPAEQPTPDILHRQRDHRLAAEITELDPDIQCFYRGSSYRVIASSVTETHKWLGSGFPHLPAESRRITLGEHYRTTSTRVGGHYLRWA